MMDPFTALSLAGTIIQFVHFSSRISRILSNIRFSTTNSRFPVEEQLRLVIADFAPIRRSLQIVSVTDHSSTNGIDLIKLFKECQDIGDALIDRLEKLRVHGSSKAWKSTRQLIKSIWSKREVESLLHRLSDLKAQLNAKILHDL